MSGTISNYEFKFTLLICSIRTIIYLNPLKHDGLFNFINRRHPYYLSREKLNIDVSKVRY